MEKVGQNIMRDMLKMELVRNKKYEKRYKR